MVGILEAAASDTPRGERLRRRVLAPLAIVCLGTLAAMSYNEVKHVGVDYGCAEATVGSGDTAIQAALAAKDALGVHGGDSLEAVVTYEAQQANGHPGVGDIVQTCVEHRPLDLANFGNNGWQATVALVPRQQS